MTNEELQAIEARAIDREGCYSIQDVTVLALCQALREAQWTKPIDALPEIDTLVDLIYYLGPNHYVYTQGMRSDAGEGWLWHLNDERGGVSLNRPNRTDCECDDDYAVVAWRALPDPAQFAGWPALTPMELCPPEQDEEVE